MAHLFGCKVGSFPFIYFGLPVGAKMKKLVSWKPVLEKFDKILADWKAHSMSFGGRLMLINSVLNRKFWWRFKTEPTSLWVKVIKSIYEVSGSLDSGRVTNYNNNSTWSIIVKTGYNIGELGIEYSNSFKKVIGNGKDTSFWNDVWLGDIPLGIKFNMLFRIDSSLNATVYDRVGWDGSLGENGKFTTKVLSNLIQARVISSNVVGNERLRNALVSKKVGIFIWRALKGRLPVLCELGKREIDILCVRCPMCDDDIETVQHTLFHCSKREEIWEKVLNWWGVSQTSFDLSNAFRGNSSIQTTVEGNKVSQAVEWTFGYLIWKNRNQKVFKNSGWNLPVALTEIQVKILNGSREM
ncbi:uncharacterized protein [Rutidosis leptorrhynchoides]|uniref:uncharacterized protein n=1 Tax=Rutidosis leptorrhynchoides TaxID=125765 RepID=UPI003A9A26EC